MNKQDYGRQIKFYGETILQFSSVKTTDGLPSLAIEMTSKESGWGDKSIVMQLRPIEELTQLALFVHPKNRENDLKIQRNMAAPKVLSLKYNEDGSLFIGIYDNKKQLSYSKVLGKIQQFSLLMMVYTRIAALYECSVSDVKEILADLIV